MSRDNRQVGIVVRVKVPAQTFGTSQGDQDGIGKDTPHEDTDHFSVLVAMLSLVGRGKGEALANRRFDGGTGRRHEVSQLVGCADSKSTDGAGREFHQVDGDDTPGTLHHELLEEGGGNHLVVGDKGVGVEQSPTDDRDRDDRESAAEDLTRPPAQSSTRQRAQVSNHLGDGHGILGEVELVFQHRRVEILRSVRLQFPLSLVMRFSSWRRRENIP